MTYTKVECELGGRTLTIETGKMAKQAGGSVVVRSGDSMVLVTATAAASPKEGIDFLPLTVEYLEKTFAAGKIPGGFFKREGKPSETATLTSRFIDRPIRPLFPENYYFDTQVIATVLSADPADNPDTLAVIGASAALAVSDIPFGKAIAGCRVARIGGKLVINPGVFDLDHADLQLIVAASADAVVMVEGNAKEVPEDEVIAAIKFAFDSLQPVIALQKDLQAKAGKPKRAIAEPVIDPTIRAAVNDARGKIAAALAIVAKLERRDALEAVKKELVTKLLTEDSKAAQKLQLAGDFENLKSQLMRDAILDQGKRIDGRSYKDIRPISCEVGLLPRAHGSALFTRGETQSLVVATLGSSDDEAIIDGLLDEYSKKFTLHYNFPAFSVGEVKPLRSPGRREIGHGYLAERALAGCVPSDTVFPYTIRIVSEILESNGSSSMASVCGGSLAMMDAGVPLKSQVAGIAMGLIKEGAKIAVLSDILGDEDHLGDMDFKVTGTRQGVTAVQMDIKIDGVTFEIMSQALNQAKEGRVHILSCMDAVLPSPRQTLAKHAPKIESFKISTDKIKDVIGPGGKNIKAIIEETGVKIDIEDDGTVKIFSPDQVAIGRAVELVEMYTDDVQIGKIYKGLVKKIVEFGAFVEIIPKRTDGLLHISQICNRRLNKVTEVLHEGDFINIKVLAIENGKIRLSMKDIGDTPPPPEQQN